MRFSWKHCGGEPGFSAALELVAGGFFNDDLSKMSEGSGKHEFQAEVTLWRNGIVNPLFGVRSAPKLPRGTVAKSGTTDVLERQRSHRADRGRAPLSA